MIINDFLDKIKSRFDIDNSVFVYSFVIILVGISSFGLGYLYKGVSANDKSVKDITIEDKDIKNTNDNVIVEKNYVASKNGKMFYPSGCSSANRIKEENRVWFSTSEEAISSGYELSSTCK